MSPGAGFAAFLLLTLVLLGMVVWTGLRARRRAHLSFVAATLGSLGVTIWYALELGKHYDLESAGLITPIHLTLAKIATASLLLPAASGARTIFVPKTRSLHRKLAFTAIALIVASAVTGTIMILLAKPIGN